MTTKNPHCPACGWGNLIPVQRYHTGSNKWMCFACGWSCLEQRDYMKLREPIAYRRFGKPVGLQGWVDPGFSCPLCDRKSVTYSFPTKYFSLDGCSWPSCAGVDTTWVSQSCSCAYCGCSFNRTSCPKCHMWSVVENLERLNSRGGDSWWAFEEWRRCASCRFAWIVSLGGSN